MVTNKTKKFDNISDPNSNPIPTQTIAPQLPPPAPPIPDKPLQPIQAGSVLRDQNGNVIGLMGNDGNPKFRTPKETEVLAQQAMANKGGAATLALEAQNQADAKAQALAAQQVQSQEAIKNIGQLTPEQQQFAQTVQQPSQIPQGAQIGQGALSGGVIGAGGAAAGVAGGAIAVGAGLAPVTAGLSLLGAAAVVGAAAVGGAVVGAIRGDLAANKFQAMENVGDINRNIAKAQDVMKKAILLANKGGNPDEAVGYFNTALSQLEQAQIQYKAEADKNSYQWETDIRHKQEDLELFMRDGLSLQRDRLILALKKPDPSYVDYSLQTS